MNKGRVLMIIKGVKGTKPREVCVRNIIDNGISFFTAKILIYNITGIAEEDINYEEEYLDKTNEIHLSIIGKTKMPWINFVKHTVNIDCFIDQNTYDDYSIAVQNGLLFIILLNPKITRRDINEKTICDICGKETENSFEYKLPDIKETSLYDGFGTKLKTLSYTIEDDIKDVCPKCRQKIAKLLLSGLFE